MNAVKTEQLSEPIGRFQQMLDKHLLGWSGIGREVTRWFKGSLTILYVYEVEKTVGEIFRGIEGKSYLNNFSMATHTNFHMYYYVICYPVVTDDMR